jgi:hypothetical protein
MIFLPAETMDTGVILLFILAPTVGKKVLLCSKPALQQVSVCGSTTNDSRQQEDSPGLSLGWQFE